MTTSTRCLRLPTEIWLAIAPYLEAKDYARLVLVSRYFYDTFLDMLQTNLIIPCHLGPRPAFVTSKKIRLNNTAKKIVSLFSRPRSSTRKPSRFAAAGPIAAFLLERLATDARLRNQVRGLHIEQLEERPRYYRWDCTRADKPGGVYDVLIGAIIGVLEGLPLLQKVEISNIEIHARWLVLLVGHRGIHLELRNAMIYGVGDYGPPPFTSREATEASNRCLNRIDNQPRTLALQCCMVCCDDYSSILSTVLSNPSFGNLQLESGFSLGLPRAFHLLRRPSLPHLQSLTITYIPSGQLDLLKALPNLKILEFSGTHQTWSFGPNEIPTGNDGTGVLPRLEKISAASALVRRFTTGRRVVSIITEDNYASGYMAMEEPEYFGSEVMVRTVEWRRCVGVDRLIDYLLAKNPGVWHLTISPTVGGRHHLLLQSLPKLVQLRELRTLQIPMLYGPLTGPNLIWQRDQCKHLRKNGSPYLLSVSFQNGLTWTRHPEEALWRPHWPRMGNLNLDLEEEMARADSMPPTYFSAPDVI